jgi:hypothetical protein
MKKITVHYAPSCAFSAAAISFLALRGADFVCRNIDAAGERRRDLERELSGQKLETPTFEVDGRLHVAPSLSSLKALLEEWGLSDEQAPHTQLRS